MTLTPPGSVPADLVTVAVGLPLLATVKEPATPVVKVVEAVEVKLGAVPGLVTVIVSV